MLFALEPQQCICESVVTAQPCVRPKDKER